MGSLTGWEIVIIVGAIVIFLTTVIFFLGLCALIQRHQKTKHTGKKGIGRDDEMCVLSTVFSKIDSEEQQTNANIEYEEIDEATGDPGKKTENVYLDVLSDGTSYMSMIPNANEDSAGYLLPNPEVCRREIYSTPTDEDDQYLSVCRSSGGSKGSGESQSLDKSAAE